MEQRWDLYKMWVLTGLSEKRFLIHQQWSSTKHRNFHNLSVPPSVQACFAPADNN